MKQIDREGIFRVIPREWWIRTPKAESVALGSAAVAVSLDFDIIEQWDGANWMSWREYEQHTVFGDYWIIKKDRTVNQGTVEQLAMSLGWDGNLESVKGLPPNVVVQVTVKADTYEGKTRYKAGWMNPGDFSPRSGAPPEEVTKLSSQFGSLLRAAAAGAAKAAKPMAAPPREERVEEPPPSGDDDAPTGGGHHSDSTGDDELPF
ncbi:MAG: hypothetical protein Q8R78_04350 [Candidatus Omnitrophota bacterium]|nr:hypothetical protein [Candidatus Omnitrophota bacterium]